MKLLKIAAGTTSETKLSCLKEVLAAIGVKAEIISMEVKSGVADQPISEAETQAGSANRAKAALKANPAADFGLGIEVGYHPDRKGDYEMFCCTAIATNQDISNFQGKELARSPRLRRVSLRKKPVVWRLNQTAGEARQGLVWKAGGGSFQFFPPMI